MARALQVLAASLALAATGADAAEVGLAARVNGAAITRERLERYFEERLEERGRLVAGIRSPAAFKSMKREALDELVDRELLWQEARRKKHVASREEVDAAMARFRERVPDPARRRLALERGGFTEEGYAEYVRRELSILRWVEREVASRVRVSAADVRALYEESAASLAEPEPELRDAIRQRLRDERIREAVAARVAALRAKARIEILVPLASAP